MDARDVATFIALLEFGGLVGLAAAALHRPSRARLAEAALPLAATVATAAMLGSLYFSEIADFVPCELCWFQRIAMYPLAPILIVAALRRDHAVRPYVLLLAALGLGVSTYHIQLQWFPDQSSFCDATNPCAARWVEAFGWMTIPQMAGVAFVLVIGLLSLTAPTEETAP